MNRLRAYAVVTALVVAATITLADGQEVAPLIEGVNTVGMSGVPGPLCVFGKQAFPVVVGKAGKNVVEPVVAAARFKRGHVVVFGHTGYIQPGVLEHADNTRLLLNAIRWAAGRTDQHPLRVGVRKTPALVAYLEKESDLRVEPVRGAGWITRLGEFDVLVVPTHALRDVELEPLRRYVADGGGVVAAGLGWGWLQLNRGHTLQEHPGNRLLAPMGIVFADGMLRATKNKGFDASQPPPKTAHAGEALRLIEQHAAGKLKLEKKELRQATWVVTRALQCLPTDDKLLRPRLRRLARKHKRDIVPTAEHPITADQALQRILLTMELRKIDSLPPARVKAHPAAFFFPGEVPKGAKHLTRKVTIDTSRYGWHSTGLYAPPGKVIVVRVPPGAAGHGLRVRIGAHSDRLWGRDTWKRCPEIVRVYDLDHQVTRAANAFGGLVYIEVPGDCKLGEVTVGLSNVVAAPYFVLGRTSLEDWRNEIRDYPAPWAELASDRVILTVPSKDIRSLDDPAAVMKVWNRIIDAAADLAGRPRQRRRPVRYVADLQISAGYMHSGYPIMTHLDAAPRMVDARHMAEDGDWGLFHELGHNHQSGDWTFGGTVEVTCNLFTLYIFETVCGKYEQARPSLFGDKRAAAIRKYLADGASFETWKRQPFLALLMYMQLKEAFGWDAYKRVFAEYRELPRDQRPKTDAEKRDQWMVRFSRTVGRNLGPFFDAWGVPVSDKAKAEVADLPAWMPPGFPP